jgi:hypothetical protein
MGIHLGEWSRAHDRAGVTATATIGRETRAVDRLHHHAVSRAARSWLRVLFVGVVGTACAARAPTRESRIPGEREDCQAAAARLAKNAATRETFTTLAWCDETGPAALAGVWRALPQDTVRLRTFFFASSNIRDARIYSAAYAAASDTSRRARERGAALLVLVAQLDSGATVGVAPASRAEVWRAQLAREKRPSQIAGTTPLPSDARARVASLVEKMAVGRPTGAAGLRDPLGVAVQAARLDLQRLR